MKEFSLCTTRYASQIRASRDYETTRGDVSQSHSGDGCCLYYSTSDTLDTYTQFHPPHTYCFPKRSYGLFGDLARARDLRNGPGFTMMNSMMNQVL